jgi:hypothetical protein
MVGSYLCGRRPIWCELFQRGAEHGHSWLSRVATSKAQFNRAIGRLQDYGLVEVQGGRYSIAHVHA